MSEERPSHRDFEEFVLWLRELRRKRKYLTIQLTLQAGEIFDVRPTPIVKPHEKLPEL
ncbi:MAG: hypothetical protein H8K07_01575 [Nitrospira sp.]|nr:hypothetical protein [Nitrospira sp.]